MTFSPQACRFVKLKALSEINGEAGYAGGTMDGSEGNNFNATITLPVSHSFGFQADTLYSRIGAGDFYGGAGHFFWRDPDIGLIGLAGGYLYRSGVDTFQLGPEASAGCPLIIIQSRICGRESRTPRHLVITWAGRSWNTKPRSGDWR